MKYCKACHQPETLDHKEGCVVDHKLSLFRTASNEVYESRQLMLKAYPGDREERTCKAVAEHLLQCSITITRLATQFESDKSYEKADNADIPPI